MSSFKEEKAVTVCGESTTSGQSRVTSSGSVKPPRVHQGEEVVSGLLLGEQVRKGGLVWEGRRQLKSGYANSS